ncbi:NXPE family member 4-like isoform X2 [Erpetoichthys calabaricus]|uniref:NXPE family member 4-like isoform X2 n=1 Tax=Erpetoichthys calabaricus TaxID=27687 RepID=UPI00109FDF1B|nr:NXPE family member 4-like isoform X2 [Erpetoichthys calabaricus]
MSIIFALLKITRHYQVLNYAAVFTTRKKALYVLILILCLASVFVINKITKIHFIRMSKEHSSHKAISHVLRKIEQNLNITPYARMTPLSSAEESLVTLLNPKPSYKVGETLSLRVDLYDQDGQHKSSGGDFLLARIFSLYLDASASGVLEDFSNGTYKVTFTLFWPGRVEVSVQLVHPSDVVSVLWKARQQDYDKIMYTGTFMSQGIQEERQCFQHLVKWKQLCKYKDYRDNEYFFCLKPKNLSCNHLTYLYSKNSEDLNLSHQEFHILLRSDLAVEVPSEFLSIDVNDCSDNFQGPSLKCKMGMKFESPGGFFYLNKWYPKNCIVCQFTRVDEVNGCLKGKQIYLLGDSTVRQWIEYLIKILKNLKMTKMPSGISPVVATDVQRNIYIAWMKHWQPWVSSTPNAVSSGQYIARRLDTIAGSTNTTVVLALGLHFRSFPITLFLKRLLNIRKAIERLLRRNPLTRVFVKLENTRDLSVDMVRCSNWHGYVQNLAQREVFQGLDIQFIDAWDMTVSHNSFAIHPSPNIVWNQLTLFLTYICDECSNTRSFQCDSNRQVEEDDTDDR